MVLALLITILSIKIRKTRQISVYLTNVFKCSKEVLGVGLLVEEFGTLQRGCRHLFPFLWMLI